MSEKRCILEYQSEAATLLFATVVGSTCTMLATCCDWVLDMHWLCLLVHPEANSTVAHRHYLPVDWWFCFSLAELHPALSYNISLNFTDREII